MWRDKRTGLWQVNFGRRQISLKTKNSHIAAQREAKLRVDFNDSFFGLRKPSRILFYDLGEQYMKSLKDVRNNSKKFAKKASAVRRRLEQHIYPEFSNNAVMTITAGRVKQWADQLLISHRPDGVNRIVTVMRAIMKWGVRNDQLGIPFDPVSHWPRHRAAQDKWTTLTSAEVRSILGTDDPEIRRIMPMLKVALFTGMRLANVVLLKWNQVDLEYGFIRIQAADTKQNDVLTVPILPEVREVLGEMWGKHPEIVFVRNDGCAWGPDSVSRIWRNGNTRLGMSRKVRFHDLRHTFASHLAMQGKPLTTIGELLGHKSPNMTKRYSHLSPDFLKQTLQGFKYYACQMPESQSKEGQNQPNESNDA